ncbi:MAG: 2-amino-3,7-dideoxy-D-threo-hept-6-ulosonate synthase [Caldiserica bacterium]|jgi:DhnA family fructose-bisphosphate aldolase class Ia|nr:2-amino-3,7-dideoxy-D-threo-hept-6-ulosonate synthase [Caldisericota bacterium]
MNSIFREDNRTVIVALDHGAIAGPMPGIENPYQTIKDAIDGGADAVLTTRGFVQRSEGAWRRETGIIMRLTGGFTVLRGTFEEELISSVEAALRLGAIGVAVTVKFGHEREGEFIRNASLISDQCELWGVPLMIEAMAKGSLYGNPLKGSADPSGIQVASRMAQELGADIIKTYYTGSPETFKKVVEGCPIPIVILGGEKTEDEEALFKTIIESLEVGGAGVAIGRNIWQGGRTKKMTRAIVGIVHEAWTLEQALLHVK